MFAPALQGLTDTQSRLLLLMGGVIARHVPQDLQTLLDEDIAEAAATLAATLETAGRGVIYEHQATRPAAQHLVHELKQLLAEVGRENDRAAAAGAPSKLDRDAAVALRRIEMGAQQTAKHLSQETGTTGSYRDLLGRIFVVAAPEQPGAARASGLILP